MWHSANYRRIYYIQLLHRKWSILHQLLLEQQFIVTNHQLPKRSVSLRTDVVSLWTDLAYDVKRDVTPSSSAFTHVGAFWFHCVKKLERKVREARMSSHVARREDTRHTEALQLLIIKPQWHFYPLIIQGMLICAVRKVALATLKHS